MPNVTLPASGSVVATDTVTGAEYQLVKIAYGAAGAAVLMDVQPATQATLSALNAKVPAIGVASPSASTPITIANNVTVGAAASVAAINTDLLTGTVSGWYDAANFHSASIQIVAGAGVTAGAIIFEQTNDTTAAPAGNVLAVEEDTSLTPTPNIAAITIAASTTRMFRTVVTARFIRVRVSTAFAGGNVQAIASFSQLPYQRMVQTVAQATAANLNVTANQGTLVSPTLSAINSAASTNITSVKATAGTVYSVVASNSGANGTGWAYVKIYNKASAPVLGTDVPLLVIPVAPGDIASVEFGATGSRFASGIALAITSGFADADTGAVAASQVKVMTSYI
jgi:hypothetical protein